MLKLVKWLTVLALLVMLGYMGRQYMRERELSRLENQAAEEFNDGNMRTAIKQYEALLEKTARQKSPRSKRVKHHLALCYKRLAENPEIPLHLSVEYYHKAAAYDAAVVDKERIEELLHAGNIVLPGGKF